MEQVDQGRTSRPMKNLLNKILSGFDFIFYVIFSYYYNHGKINEKHYPPVGKTYFIMVMLFGSFFLLLFFIIDQYTHWSKNPTMNAYGSKIAVFIAMICTYFIFIYRKRYIYVYERFKNLPLANSKKGKLLGWVLYFIGLASPIIFTYIIFKIKTS